MKQTFRLKWTIFLGLIAFAFLVGLPLLFLPATQAAPLPAPTPVGVAPLGVGKVVKIFATEGLTQTTRHCTRASAFNTLDVQHTIDISSTNAVTLTLEYSNDAANFEAGPELAGDVSADESVLNQYASFGAFACANAELETSELVTVTITAVGK